MFCLQYYAQLEIYECHASFGNKMSWSLIVSPVLWVSSSHNTLSVIHSDTVSYWKICPLWFLAMGECPIHPNWQYTCYELEDAGHAVPLVQTNTGVLLWASEAINLNILKLLARGNKEYDYCAPVFSTGPGSGTISRRRHLWARVWHVPAADRGHLPQASGLLSTGIGRNFCPKRVGTGKVFIHKEMGAGKIIVKKSSINCAQSWWQFL